MTIKALSLHDMKAKLGDMVEGRPWLASLIMNGHSSFSDGKETYALRDSPALSRGEPELVTREMELPAIGKRSSGYDRARAHVGPEGAQALGTEIREEMKTEERSAIEAETRQAPLPAPAPALSVTRATPPVHVKLAARLGGTDAKPLNAKTALVDRIAIQREVATVRSIGIKAGARPSALAGRLAKLGGAA